MAKDPAFLFYPNDYLGGTMYFTFEEKGAYIELLVHQFNTGKFTLAQAEQVLNTCFHNVWNTIKIKFTSDGEVYWNIRLQEEIDKRKRFSESRRQNALGKGKREEPVKKVSKHNISGVIDIFNNIMGKDVKLTDSRKKQINARYEEGYVLVDFATVVQRMKKEWENDPEMSKYLTPDTLFSTKFSKYHEMRPAQKTTTGRRASSEI